MKKRICFLLVSLACVLNASEHYESQGFCMDIEKNGCIKNIRYAKQPLIDNILLKGQYKITEKMEKHDARLFQTWDYEGVANFSREGKTLTFDIDSTMGNKIFKDAVNYKIKCILQPNEISFNCEVTSKIDIWSDYHIFKNQIEMSSKLFGNGIKILSNTDQEEFRMIPEKYDPKFKIPLLKQFQISTTKGILSFMENKDIHYSYMDSRQWGGESFTISATPKTKWTPKPVLYPAGTVWKWDLKIKFTPAKEIKEDAK